MLNSSLGERRSRYVATMLTLAVLFTAVLASCPQWVRAAEAITWDGPTSGGSWHIASNWDRDRVPQNGDLVVIPGGNAVEFSTGSVSITLQCAGSLTVTAGTVTLTGASSLTGGKLDGTGQIVISGSDSSLDWQGGQIIGVGPLTVESNAKLWASAAGLVLNRPLTNKGTVHVVQGLKLAAGSQGTGGFTVSGGKLLEFASGVYQVGGTVHDAGNSANFTASTNAVVTFDGSYNIVNNSILAGCAVTWNNTATIGALNVNGAAQAIFNGNATLRGLYLLGNISGSGNLLFTGSPRWQAGSIQGSGTLTVASGATLQLVGDTPKNLSKNFVNNGTVRVDFTGASLSYGQLSIAGTATLAGQLHLSFPDMYVPAEGATLRPVTFGSTVMGTFSEITSSSNDRSFTPTYDGGGLTLLAVSTPVPPTLASFSPVNGAVGADKDTKTVAMIFSEPVWGQSNKYIRVYHGVDDATPSSVPAANNISVIGHGTTNIAATFSGWDPQYGETYHIIMDDGAFADVAGNGCAGISDSTTWSFTIESDTVAPLWTADYPKVAEIGTNGFTLIGKADEAGTLYFVVLANNVTAPTSTEVRTGTGAVASGSVALIAESECASLVTGLTATTDYDIYVVAEDSAGNLQSGPVKVDVATSAEVIDTTPPVLTGFTPNTGVSSPPTQLVLTFDEPVWGQTGKNIRLCRNVGVTTITTSIAADSDQVSGDGTNTIVVSIPAGTLLYGQQHYVIAERGSFKDAAGNEYAGISSAATWRFTVGPIWATDYPIVRDITQTSANVTAKMIYPGTAYCVAVEPEEHSPNSEQVKEGKNRSGVLVPAGHSGQCALEATAEGTVSLENLVPGAEYDVFVVAEDAAGNLSYPVKLPLPTVQPPETDFWRYRSPLPTVNGFWNVKFANDRFFALADHGTLLVSADGQAWERVETGTLFRLEDIAYSNGRYVLTANDGSDTALILTSDDAVNWRHLQTFSNVRITGLVVAADKFVAVADNGIILVSTDGLSWNAVASGIDGFLQSVAYGDGTFVAVGLNGSVTTSTDGETWTAQTLVSPSPTLWNVTYAEGKFVAVGDYSNNPYVYYSSDKGATWSYYRPTAYGSSYHAVLHDGTRFVVLGFGPNGTCSGAASSDGQVWTELYAEARPSHGVVSTAIGNGTIVAVGGYSNISTSVDGTNWTYRTLGSTYRLRSVVYGGSLYVAVGQQGIIQTSPDGITWTPRSSGTTYELNMVRYLNNQFVVTGNGGKILTSHDGITWTSRPSGRTNAIADVAYGGGQYMAVGEDGAILSSTDNGATWTIVTHTFGYPDLNAIGYGNGWFVSLGDYRQVYRSNDGGVTWSESSLADNYAQDITFLNGRFVAVGYDKAWCSDDNGATWSRWGLNGHYVYSVAHGGGTLMTVGQYGTIYASFDGGDTWTQQDFPTISIDNEARTLYGIAAGPTSFVIVGDRGLTLQSRDFGFAGDLDEVAVAASKAALTFDVIKGTNTAASNIISALNLITDGGDGVSISWTAVPTSYITTADGTVTRPTASTGDVTLTLTATLTKGTASDTKSFSLIVKALELTADEAISLDTAALTWDVINGANSSQSQVTSNLVLPAAGANGTTISWSVEPVDSGLNASTGAVTRPGNSQGDQTVTLTATISKTGGTNQTKSFTITIKATPAPYVPSPDPDPTSVITSVARTPGDWLIDRSLIRTGQATISLSNAGANTTSISTAALKRLAEHGLPITIITPDVTLALDPDALMVSQITEWGVGRSQLDISISEVVGAARETVLTETEVTNRNGRITVEGRVYDIKIVLKSTDANGRATSHELTHLEQQIDLAVMLGDLSELSDNQINRLTAALLGGETNGALSPVWLQGEYDSASSSFSFSTDVVGRFAFVVVEPPALVVDLTIDTNQADINGVSKPIDVPPSLISDRTMVPIRFVAEAMGADVLWLPATKIVRIELNGRIVELVIGQTDPQTGLDVPAQIVVNRTLVPLRFVAESLGATVQWLPDTRGVEILVFSAPVE